LACDHKIFHVNHCDHCPYRENREHDILVLPDKGLPKLDEIELSHAIAMSYDITIPTPAPVRVFAIWSPSDRFAVLCGPNCRKFKTMRQERRVRCYRGNKRLHFGIVDAFPTENLVIDFI